MRQPLGILFYLFLNLNPKKVDFLKKKKKPIESAFKLIMYQFALHKSDKNLDVLKYWIPTYSNVVRYQLFTLDSKYY